MNNLKTIGAIVALLVGLLTIISLTQGIFGIPPIKDWDIWKPQNTIQILVEPNHINEGQQPYVDFTITIPAIEKSNITHFDLARNNIIIDRQNKNDQTTVTSSLIFGEGSWNYDYLFYVNKLHTQYPQNLVAKIKLSGCTDCFMGEQSPYVFTFTVKYRIGDGELKTETQKKIIKII